MAAHRLIASLIFRLILPLALATCCGLRFCLPSLEYLILLLVNPILPAPTSTTMQGHTGRYLRAVVGLSVINFLLQFIFQIVLLSLPPYAYFMERCGFVEELLRHLGFVRLDGISEIDGTRWLLPECLMLVFSVGTYLACVRLTTPASPSSDVIAVTQAPPDRNVGLKILNTIGTYLALAGIGGAGVMVPSVTSAVYFVVFLACATYWSLNKVLGRRFGYVCRLMMVFAGVHVLCLFVYQTQWVQWFLPPDNLGVRIFGMTALVTTDCCRDSRAAYLTTDEWSHYCNPALLVVLYYVLAFESQFLLSNKLLDDGSASPASTRQPRILAVEGNRRSGSSPTPTQPPPPPPPDPNGSIRWSTTSQTVQQQQEEAAPPKKLEKEQQQHQPGGGEDEGGAEDEEADNPLQQLMAPLVSVFQLVIRSSYIATNIVMMAWSITYHSWLTFVLLLWACVLWMIPSQRAAMLRCSPFLVVYAELLLLLQYIYCMDLTDDELPSEVKAVNLGQIGLVKYRHLPCLPLIVKVLYTTMFWITLRQYVQEVVEVSRREVSTAAALQPFTVAVSTTTSGRPVSQLVVQSQEETAASPMMEKIGQWVRALLVKFWIWVVAIMLFVFGIQGSVIVIFRIMYMVLFLTFTITFQLSYSKWRNFLYGFWLTVITYQMLVLVLTYTYQFDNFPTYWEEYIGIPEQLQNDIGLEVYDTGRLFIKLMTPTFFVIVTIIQVHYFHKDFLELSDIEQITEPTESKLGTVKAETKPPQYPKPNLLESCTLSDAKKFVLHYLHKVTGKVLAASSEASELGWRFLELHLTKIVLGSVMMLACYDVCALHFIFALLATIAVMCGERVQTRICQACVVIASILLIARMIYQIGYIDQEGWAPNCSEYTNVTLRQTEANMTGNNAVWLGFSKTSDLPKYLKGYIGIIVVITVQAVVGIRQQYHRKVLGLPPPPPGILFPNVTRAIADDGLPECGKFLLNYGFYKFGVEICLISLVGVIGTRLDVYSLFYAAWLCYFYNRRRKDIAKVWWAFSVSVSVLIPLQYLMCIGMPSGLCLDYPWVRTMMEGELREWLFFPDFVKPPESYKIVTDFCLLVFAVCQQRVFELEFADGADQYEGGSNNEIAYEDPATLANPIPDFVTYTRNYLDMAKVVVFFTFYWITLAVMFLSGTNRVTLFALGYVVGAFVFLWHGNEFYLQPLPTILRLWNYLLGYNVSVILVKTFLQMLGCVFLDPLAKNVCWLVQLLGVACVKKFGDKSDDEIAAALAPYCAVPKTEAGLMWDGLCFGFLILQRRLFTSFYFQHLVTEMKAQTELASRGAELIAELMRKEIAEQQAAEREVLNKIKEKMERIKASQQKVKGASYRKPRSHYEAIRSGDYYMFEEYDDAEDSLAPLEKPDEPYQDDTTQGFTISEVRAAGWE